MAASPPFLVIDNFLPQDLAEGMRAGIETHFSEPFRHGAAHQVWNYWFVPGQYTYLRTSAEKVIERQLVDAFANTLRLWSVRTLGLSEPTWPFLSLYINGCRQGVHNDALNGHYAFVYSLTRNERRSIGGETLIYHEGDLFRRGLVRASAGSDFFTSVAPEFNRLVVFDDRMPHAVSAVEGPMDPLEGRFVLHGHLKAASAIVEGALPAETVIPLIGEAIGAFAQTMPQGVNFGGLMTVRMAISASGRVERCEVLLDRVVSANTSADWDPLAQDIVARLKALSFPAAQGPTHVLQPISVTP